MRKRDIERAARVTLRFLALHQRNKKAVMATYGTDAATVCVCSSEVDAEVIVRALNELRANRHKSAK